MKLIIFLCLFTFSNILIGQNPNIKRTYHWFFGDSAGVDFSSGNPIPDTLGSLSTLEGCSSMSDTSGNLLFYTNGINVWDSTHNLMPNGFGLFGDESSQNSALIIPKPNSSNIYYIFTTPAYGGQWTTNNALSYSEVDMNLNNGLGDVTIKNITLIANSTEQLGAVFHKNKRDYWVVGHEVGSNNFMAFLITPAGVNSVPVISSVGKHIDPYNLCWYCAVSSIKFSPSGCKLATCYNNSDTLQLFDFDNNSGNVLNPITLGFSYPWTSSFSPDNNLLYVGTFDAPNNMERLFQFNLSSGTSSGIMSSMTILSNIYGSQSTLQLGPDGKIYGARYQDGYLAVINSPDSIGIACDFIYNGFYLGGKTNKYGLPNFVESYFNNDTTDYSCAVVGLENFFADDNIDLYPNPAYNYIIINSNKEIETIEIFDVKGKKMAFTINSSFSINIESFPRGIYIIKITTKEDVISKKLIKQ